MISLLLLISCESKSHNIRVYDCETLKSVIIDSALYDNVNGNKLIYNFNLNEIDIYKVINLKTKRFYYVSEKMKQKIEMSIIKNNCLDVRVEEIAAIEQDNIQDENPKGTSFD